MSPPATWTAAPPTSAWDELHGAFHRPSHPYYGWVEVWGLLISEAHCSKDKSHRCPQLEHCGPAAWLIAAVPVDAILPLEMLVKALIMGCTAVCLFVRVCGAEWVWYDYWDK